MAGARVRVSGISKEVVTTRNGEFWRVLSPGQYSVTALTDGRGGGEVRGGGRGGRVFSQTEKVTVGTRGPVEVHLALPVSTSTRSS